MRDQTHKRIEFLCPQPLYELLSTAAALSDRPLASWIRRALERAAKAQVLQPQQDDSQ